MNTNLINKLELDLKEIGILMYDDNNKIKSLDNILFELGSKWNHIKENNKKKISETITGFKNTDILDLSINKINKD